jgi:hypothetical protein
VFGWWVAFIWCGSHDFLCVFVIHSFCNAMGFPDFGAALNWRRPGERRLIWAAYVCGLLAFACLVFVLVRMSVDATV